MLSYPCYPKYGTYHHKWVSSSGTFNSTCVTKAIVPSSPSTVRIHLQLLDLPGDGESAKNSPESRHVVNQKSQVIQDAKLEKIAEKSIARRGGMYCC